MHVVVKLSCLIIFESVMTVISTNDTETINESPAASMGLALIKARIAIIMTSERQVLRHWTVVLVQTRYSRSVSARDDSVASSDEYGEYREVNRGF